MILRGKKVLITGASRGIGRAIALAYAAEGADVAITGRNYANLKPIIDEIENIGRKAEGFEWDVSRIDGFDRRIEEIAGKLEGLDVVVNNAGIAGREQFLEVTEKEWNAVIDTNLKGLYFICQAAANFMIERKHRGKIINIASDAGLRGASKPYGISKWGVIGLTKGIAKILLPHGILVNAIAPGPVATEIISWHPGKTVEITSPTSPALPFKRRAYPEEIAKLAVFLASENSSRIAGSVITINGGL